MNGRIRFIAPIGELPSPCPELQKRLAKLPENYSLSDFMRVISKWEEWAVRRYKRMEQTKHSGWLDPDPYHRTSCQRANEEK